MSRQPQTLAQRYRRARESFLLANQLGCSPAEALERKRSEEADRCWRESGERLRAAMNAPLLPRPTDAPGVGGPVTTPEAPRRWWLD